MKTNIDDLKNSKVLISACLLGKNCRYSGKLKPNQSVIKLSKDLDFTPICPEVMGGLPTPRPGAERIGDRVVMEDGTDVTDQFRKGAGKVLKIAQENDIEYAILKQRSPSCGSGQIYKKREIIEGYGVCAELLKNHDLKILSEGDIEKMLEA